jgi:hypothetical protein
MACASQPAEFKNQAAPVPLAVTRQFLNDFCRQWSVAFFRAIPDHVLRGTKGIESFTEAQLKTSAKAIQPAPTVLETARISTWPFFEEHA